MFGFGFELCVEAAVITTVWTCSTCHSTIETVGVRLACHVSHDLWPTCACNIEEGSESMSKTRVPQHFGTERRLVPQSIFGERTMDGLPANRVATVFTDAMQFAEVSTQESEISLSAGDLVVLAELYNCAVAGNKPP